MPQLNLLLLVLAAAAVSAKSFNRDSLGQYDSCTIKEAKALSTVLSSWLPTASFAACDTKQDQALQLHELIACISLADSGDLQISDSCYESFFGRFDVDRNGVIDEEEFQALLSAVRNLGAPARKKLMSLRQSLNDVEVDPESNSNTEHSCTEEEVMALMKSLTTTSFDSCDKNQDQVLQREELIACISSAVPGNLQISDSCYEFFFAQDLFAKVDVNGDGTMYREEFQKLMSLINSFHSAMKQVVE